MFGVIAGVIGEWMGVTRGRCEEGVIAVFAGEAVGEALALVGVGAGVVGALGRGDLVGETTGVRACSFFS